jgi:hypothetical protein
MVESRKKLTPNEAPITAEEYANVKPLIDEILELQRQRYDGGECPPEDLAGLVVEVCRNYADERLKELKRRIALRE